jgi:hypothetical protein
MNGHCQSPTQSVKCNAPPPLGVPKLGWLGEP